MKVVLLRLVLPASLPPLLSFELKSSLEVTSSLLGERTSIGGGGEIE